MHLETALITAPVALAAYAHASGGIKQALLSPKRSALKPLGYGLGALLAAELGHHNGGWVDAAAHLAGGLMLWLALLELTAWIPRPARARA